MKNFATLIVLIILQSTIINLQSYAQAPKMMNYQGVARNADGQTLVNKQINLRLSIISADDVNDAVYKEEQLVTTNEFGLFAIKIGEGSPLSGSMDAIDWGSADHYISVEMDVDNNGHYAFMGTSQLLSVPYAFYAETAGKATNLENTDQLRAIDFTGTSGQTIRHNGSEWEASSTIYNNGTNVGLGTTSPAAKLDVNGNVNLTLGKEITFGGDRALAVDANRNIMQGRQTGAALTSGVNNNMIGYRAGWKNTTGSNNSIIGYNAGYTNTTGSSNMFLGYKAGYSNTTGSNNFYGGLNAGYGSTSGINNIALGTTAGFSLGSANNNTFIGRNSGYNTTANENVFIGYEAGYDNTTGTKNTYIGTGADGSVGLTNATAIGYNALVEADNSLVLGNNANVGIGTTTPEDKLHVKGNIRVDSARIEFVNTGNSIFIGEDAGLNDDFTDNDNVGIGYNAMSANTSGYRNVAVGASALLSNTTGGFNVAIGSENLRSNTTGSYNVAMGHDVLYYNTTGRSNIGIGYGTMILNTTGEFNIAVGETALVNNTTGSENIALGVNALNDNTTGAYNMGIGGLALKNNETGNANIALGHYAGFKALGDSNIFIGYHAGFNETGSHKLYIDNSNADSSEALIYGEFDNNLLAINGTLRVNDGTQADGYVLTSDSLGNTSWEYINEKQTLTFENDLLSITDGDTVDLSGLRTIGNAGLVIITDEVQYTLDIEQTNQTSSQGSITNTWQSFVPTQTGYLSQIDLKFAVVSGFNEGTLSVYKGEGTVGDLLAFFPIDSITSDWHTFDLSDNVVAIDADSLYTFQFNASSGNFIITKSTINSYPDGRANFGSSQDLVFRTYYSTYGAGQTSEVLSFNTFTADSASFNMQYIDTLSFSDGTYLTSGSISSAFAFDTLGGVVIPGSAADIANDDFVFGSTQLDDDGDSDHDKRFFFDKDKAAFRAGQVPGTNWDTDSLGQNSFASGYDTKASGLSSSALGFGTKASGLYSIALGYYSTASGNNSIALGNLSTASATGSIAIGALANASGTNSAAIGFNTTAKSAYETTFGSYNTTYTPNSTSLWDESDRLFSIGNGSGSSDKSDALVILKSGEIGIGTSTPDTTLHVIGQIKYEDGNQADGYVLTSDADGNASWQLAASGDVLADVDNDTKVQVEKNSDEDIIRFDITNNERMVLNSEGLGIGTTPTARLHVAGFGTSAIDQSVTSESGHTNDVVSEWQSLEAGITGAITQIDLKFDASSDDRTLNVYEGEGVDGALLFSGSISVPASGWNSYDVGNIPIESGEMYTIGLSTASKWNFNNTGVYADGTAGNYGSRDYLFRTYVAQENSGFQVSDDGVYVYNYLLPSLDGSSGQVLSTDGSGTASWADVSSVFEVDTFTIISDADGDTKIQVEESSDEDYIRFDVGGVDAMVINDIGYVGIGTTDPNTELDVETSDASTTVRVYNGSGDGTARAYVGSVGGGHINLIANASGSDVYGIPDEYPGIATQYKDMVFATGSSGNNSTEKMRLTTGGNLGIGTTNPGYKLQVNGQVAGTSAFVNTSDGKYKTNVQPIGSALSKIEKLQGVSYDWKTKEYPEMQFDERKQLGFIAQEVETIIPEAVSINDKGDYGLSYTTFTPLLVEAIKEMEVQLKALQKENAELKGENELFKAQLLEEKTNNQSRLERIEAELGIDIKASRK